jgi:hypothetical protein
MTPELLVGVLVMMVGFVTIYAVSAAARLRSFRKAYNEAWEGWSRADRAYATVAEVLQQIANALPDPAHRYVVPSKTPKSIEPTRALVQDIAASVGLALARRPTVDDIEAARANYQRLAHDLVARRDDDRQKIEAWRQLLDQVERALRGEQLTRGHDDPQFSPVVSMALILRREEKSLREWRRRVAEAANLRIPYDEIPEAIARITASVTDVEADAACRAYLRSTDTPRKHKSASITGMRGALSAFLADRIGRDE